MKTIEELFEKVNKERIELSGHKNKLKTLLMNSDYFNKKEETFDWKLTFSSLAFSAILIVFAFSSNYSIPQNISNTMPAAGSGEGAFYSKLIKNKNFNSAGETQWNNQTVNLLQTVNNNTKTVFYFNERNVLVNTEVYNNK